jgi:hypothetical protein
VVRGQLGPGFFGAAGMATEAFGYGFEGYGIGDSR